MTIGDVWRRLWQRPPARRPHRRLELETLEARDVPAVIWVTTTSDARGEFGEAGAGTLRRAIYDANDSVEQDIIRFDLGPGVQTITLIKAALPKITAPVIIDAANVPDDNPGQKVVLTRTTEGDDLVTDGSAGLEFSFGPNPQNAMISQSGAVSDDLRVQRWCRWCWHSNQQRDGCRADERYGLQES